MYMRYLARVLAPYLLVAITTSSTGCIHKGLSTTEPDQLRRASSGAEIGAIIAPHFEFQDQVIRTKPLRSAQNDQIVAENDRLIAELRQRGIDVRYSDRGVVVNLPDVLFKTGEAQLTTTARETVFEIAQVLKRAPSRNLLVEGHTDAFGDIQYNYTLSLARAQEVARALLAEGIPESKISTRGYGETTPIASNQSEQGRRRNRRVEVIILS